MSSVKQQAGGRPRHEQWEAVCHLFGQPLAQPARDEYDEVANDLERAHYSEEQILRAGRLYQRDHADWAFTPMGLLTKIDQLLRIDRAPPVGEIDVPAPPRVVVDEPARISLLDYAMSDAGKADPNLSEETKIILRRTWQRSKQA